ncbi:DEBR0S5_05578g1_1 [Brettanomyces bruxellensis]|uniref:DEBR0S5_05578g1_1 n=1 Tax=Dekkera bruxellensis TaxID=5007 RepID=A0A3F2Y545_DEKBR|nr:DEBR0S5_05578g1_1 [Brettanomyces bruxellensis]
MYIPRAGFKFTRNYLRFFNTKRFVSTGTTTIKRSPSAKGVFLGFFAGASISGIACYYYIMEEYKATSSAVVSDVLRLQKAVEKLDKHVTDVEIELAKK